MSRFFLIFIIKLCLITPLMSLTATSVIQVTLSDTNTGLLEGNHPAEVMIIDQATNIRHWHTNQTLTFKNGFTEIILGPVDDISNVKSPRVVVLINQSRLEFPIHPTLFSVHSHRAEQLSDTTALFVKNGNVGFGVNEPAKKIDILGDIQIQGAQSSIMFKDGPSLTALSLTQLLQLPNQISTSFNQVNQTIQSLNQDVTTSVGSIQSTISALQASINILETQTGASPIQISGNYDNQLLKINLNGEIAPFTDLYQSNQTNYFLRTNQGQSYATEFSDQFSIINNQLTINETDRISIQDHPLPNTISNGQIRYNNGNFYVANNGSWRNIIEEHSIDEYLEITNQSTNQVQLGANRGGLLFDGTNYHLWQNGWQQLHNPDASQLPVSNSATFVVVNDDNAFSKRSLSTNASLTLNQSGLKVNDSELTDQALVVWQDNQFKAVTIPSNSGLSFNNRSLSLAAPIQITQNSKVGIGIDPTETLDVNGAIRLRTLPLQSQSNVSAGSILFDGNHFKGWDGSEWHVFTQATTSTGSTNDWQTNGSNLTTSPNGNVGIKVDNPQATLDINGSVRIRDISNTGTSHPVMMIDTNGDVMKGSLSFSDVLPSVSGATNGQLLGVSNNAWAPVDLQGSSTIAMDGFQAHLSTSNIRDNDVYMFKNNQWQAQQLTSSNRHITLTSTGLDLATSNVSNRSILYFDTDAWVTQPLINPNREVMIDSDGLRLSQMGAITGQQLTWDGASWVPSRNETVSYQAANGVQLINNTFQLASNLSWANNTFT
ncbi:MAG: hypothetical protein ACON35_08825, partial [Candidatus Marinamargulisbacteria bacterium]